MGADIYLRWDGMTEEERKQQFTGFSVISGKYGYLRGAYNGHVGWDAIQVLFKNISFDSDESDWKVDIKILKTNLNLLEKGLFMDRKNDFYEKDNESEIKSYRDFVAFAEKKLEEGKNPTVHFSC